MHLSHLIYLSNVAPWFVRMKNFEAKLQALCSVARIANQKRRVTGLLLYNSGHFLQVLEGDTEEVKKLFEKIRIDLRHDGIVRLAHYPIHERVFERWDMGLLDFSSQSNLDPELFHESLASLRNAAFGGVQSIRSSVLSLLRVFQEHERLQTLAESSA